MVAAFATECMNAKCYEADLKVGRVNIGSPIARALIGKEEGDTAEVQAPGGLKSYAIVTVRYI